MSRSRARGFTLIEILVVIVIISILASAVVLTMRDRPDQASAARSQADIHTLGTALEAFRLDMRRYPTEAEGLRALVKKPDTDDANWWKGPYIDKVPTDGWSRPYVYHQPGYHNTDSFDLFSYGKDGQEGGENMDADIANWSEDAG